MMENANTNKKLFESNLFSSPFFPLFYFILEIYAIIINFNLVSVLVRLLAKSWKFADNVFAQRLMLVLFCISISLINSIKAQ